MSDAAEAGRNAPRKRLFRSVAAQAAVLSAAVHFLWAWPRLGDPDDLRPYVFVLGGVFAVGVAVATLRADEYRRLYAFGAGILFAFLSGYVGWHGADAAAAIATDPLAIVGKAAEIVGVVAFLGLYRLAPPTSVVVERRGAGVDDDRGGERDADGRDADGRDADEGNAR